MSAEPSPSPATSTIVQSGGVLLLAPPIARSFSGGALQISHLRIEDEIRYVQHSPRHLLHVTLGRRTARSMGSVGGDEWTRMSHRGSISFTPAGSDRQGLVGRGEIKGLQIEFDQQFVEEACEQRLDSDWRYVFNDSEAKILAIAEALAAASALGLRGGPTVEMMQLAIARQVGRAYGGAEHRRDDGWLHPQALARVIDQLLADPARIVSLQEMAQTAGLGVSAFVRAFRGAVGSTPAAFAMKLRLDHATTILRSTSLGLSEVAALSGFSSSSHLVRAYRARHGVTPARLRRESRGTSIMSRNPREHSRSHAQDIPPPV